MSPRRCTLSSLFATSTVDQKFVAIELYQGEDSDVGGNRRLGRVVLGDLPPGPAGSVRVELTLTIDVESILNVTARELKSGQEASVTIRPTGGLSQGEIFEIVARRRQESGLLGKLPSGLSTGLATEQSTEQSTSVRKVSDDAGAESTPSK